MDDMFLFNQDNNNPELVQLNMQENINDSNPNSSEKLSAIFILIISLILIGMDFVSLYYSYRYILLRFSIPLIFFNLWHLLNISEISVTLEVLK